MGVKISGSGAVDQWQPDQQQYRVQQNLLPYEPLFRPDYQAHPTPTSAVRQLTLSGQDTWNKTFTLEYPLTRREPIGSQQPQVVVNYVMRNPAASMDPTPIPIAQYAVNTGLIYVGAN